MAHTHLLFPLSMNRVEVRTVHCLFWLILLLFLKVTTSFMCALVFLWQQIVLGTLRPLPIPNNIDAKLTHNWRNWWQASFRWWRSLSNVFPWKTGSHPILNRTTRSLTNRVITKTSPQHVAWPVSTKSALVCQNNLFSIESNQQNKHITIQFMFYPFCAY